MKMRFAGFFVLFALALVPHLEAGPDGKVTPTPVQADGKVKPAGDSKKTESAKTDSKSGAKDTGGSPKSSWNSLLPSTQPVDTVTPHEWAAGKLWREFSGGKITKEEFTKRSEALKELKKEYEKKEAEIMDVGAKKNPLWTAEMAYDQLDKWFDKESKKIIKGKTSKKKAKEEKEKKEKKSEKEKQDKKKDGEKEKREDITDGRKFGDDLEGFGEGDGIGRDIAIGDGMREAQQHDGYHAA